MHTICIKIIRKILCRSQPKQLNNHKKTQHKYILFYQHQPKMQILQINQNKIKSNKKLRIKQFQHHNNLETKRSSKLHLNNNRFPNKNRYRNNKLKITKLTKKPRSYLNNQ